jgi:predicted RNA-binding protein (virulence factor B family)
MRELASPVRVGERRVVRVALDARTDRVIASARLNRYLNLTPPTYTEGQPVHVLVTGETPLGYNAIIENAHRGLLYRSDLAGPLATGTEHDAYVRAVRADGKVDLALDRAGFHRIAPLTEQILTALEAAGGHLKLHDNSSPEEIRAEFGISKKAFKQAIGALYRAKRIVIEKTGIRAVKKS